MKRRTARTQTLFLLCVFLGAAVLSIASTPVFFPDDPAGVEPDPEDASGAQPWDIGLLYDSVLNIFHHPGDPARDVRARDINTIDEVPDSSWFTNRVGAQPMTAEDVRMGPHASDGPAAGPWVALAAVREGTTPQLTIRDGKGLVWNLKFDPPGSPAMATGAAMITTRLLWALGYNVRETHLARLLPERIEIDPSALVTAPSGPPRRLTRSGLAALLRRVRRDPDGSYRVAATLVTPGRQLGGFRFYGTRPDDPNDVIPHEHRRSLRGLRVAAAWLNMVDARATHTLDTLVKSEDHTVVRHELIDLEATLGSAGVQPREAWEGVEPLYGGVAPARKDLVRFGFRVEPWRTMPMFESKCIGRFRRDQSAWDPDAWTPRVPNAAFLRADAGDRFWAARKISAITDDEIRAAIQSAEYGDTESEAFLVRALIERRDRIARAYLPAINPVVDPELRESLTFHNAAVEAGGAASPQEYRATWFSFDNLTGESTEPGRTASRTTEIPAPQNLPSAPGSFVCVDLSASHPDFPSWETPVRATFRLDASGWKLVGLSRH